MTPICVVVKNGGKDEAMTGRRHVGGALAAQYPSRRTTCAMEGREQGKGGVHGAVLGSQGIEYGGS